MRLFQKVKDGGPESHVWAYVLIEWKAAFSVILLRFEDGSRDAFHNHAFNSISWLLKGELLEDYLSGLRDFYWPSIIPIHTPRSRFHRVTSVGRSWLLNFRGPWRDTWNEVDEAGRAITLTHGRKVLWDAPYR